MERNLDLKERVENVEKETKGLNVYQKLQACRVELQKQALKKSGVNSFAKFKYYELADFIPTVNELFRKYNLFSAFNIEGTVTEGVAELEIINSENTSEVIKFVSPTADANIKGSTPVQSLGGVHTYLKRYLYQNALEIVESDVLDAVVGDKKQEPKRQEHHKMTAEQIIFIQTLPENLKGYACKKFNLNQIGELSQEQAQYIMDSMSKKGNANGNN